MAETEHKSAAVGVHVDTPRDVANKSDKGRLLRAIRMALDIESTTVRANTQHFNRGRYRAVTELPDYEALRIRRGESKINQLLAFPS